MAGVAGAIELMFATFKELSGKTKVSLVPEKEISNSRNTIQLFTSVLIINMALNI